MKITNRSCTKVKMILSPGRHSLEGEVGQCVRLLRMGVRPPCPIVNRDVTVIIRPWKAGKNERRPPTTLVVLVKSSVGSFDRRRTIRETWASPAAVAQTAGVFPFETVFLVGKTASAGVMAKVGNGVGCHLAQNLYFFSSTKRLIAHRWPMRAVPMMTCWWATSATPTSISH